MYVSFSVIGKSDSPSRNGNYTTLLLHEISLALTVSQRLIS